MISREDLQEKIRVWLFEELAPSGSRIENVRAYLVVRGFKGIRGNSRLCPVAMFLNKKIAELVDAGELAPGTSVAVGNAFLTVYDAKRSLILTDVWLPPVVSDFVMNFDAPDYAQELVA